MKAFALVLALMGSFVVPSFAATRGGKGKPKTATRASVVDESAATPAAETAEPATLTPTEPVEFKPKHAYLGGTVGLTFDRGIWDAAKGLGFGVGFDLGAIIAQRFNLGGFAKGRLGTNYWALAIFGDTYTSSCYGLEFSGAAFYTERDQIRLGAKAGYFEGKVTASSLFSTSSSAKITAWAVGPVASYLHFFGKTRKFGIGGEISYDRVLSPAVETTYAGNTSKGRGSDFGIYDFDFKMQFRF